MKNFKIILLWTFVVISTSVLYSQEKGTLRGLVTDSTSGEVLVNANVYVKELNTGTTSDSKGYFLITGITGNRNYNVVVSYIGYEPKKIEVTIAANRVTHVDFKLKPISVDIGTVEKVGERVPQSNATDIGLQKISLREIESIPKGVEADLFRSLKFLPGVQATSDITARYNVRGGASNQNEVLFDDIPIYNPFHALGLFSVIDPEVINSVEFYKGGFTAERSGRLSSVLNVITKDGNKNRFSGSASGSFLTAKASIEGPIPHGSFIITGRTSHSNDILKKFLNDETVPINFYDFTFKGSYSNPDFIKDAKFTISAFASKDRIDYNDDFKPDYYWKNNLIGAKYFQVSDSPLFYEISMSLSTFEGGVNQNQSLTQPQFNKLSQLLLKYDFTYVYDSKDELDLGLKISDVSTDLELTNTSGIKNKIYNKGANISVYGKYKVLRWENFGLDGGLRVNLTGLVQGGRNKLLEPRISMTYRMIPQLSFKTAWGIYQQELTTLFNEKEVISLFEPWIITPQNLSPATAIHYTAGFDYNPSILLNITLEGYYKIVHNLPVFNENKIYVTDPDLIAGRSEAYGLELYTKYEDEKFRATASYTWSRAFKEVNGFKYPPKYDARHVVNLSVGYKFWNDWHAGVSWSFRTGLPFTQVQSFYDKLDLNDLRNPFPIYDSFFPTTVYASTNGSRLPYYHKLDITLSKKFILGDFNIYVDASIINVYNRKNIFYFDKTTGQNIYMLPFLPTATVKVEL
jgi:hypothetical protein